VPNCAAQLWLAADETSLALGFAAEAWYVSQTRANRTVRANL
jgi:hypothetical protein